jgi:quercetin 2,3-dioxygenase
MYVHIFAIATQTPLMKFLIFAVFNLLISFASFSQASQANFKYVLHKADTRGETKAGWLHAKHTFTFNNYYDPERMNFGALRVFNDDRIDRGRGFPTHPHNNMEIITIVLKGSVFHKDDFGNSGVIKAGDVQIMSAGTGINHSEANNSSTEDIELFQVWVFPNKKDVKPRYQQKSGLLNNLPKNGFRTLVSPSDTNAVFLYQNAVFVMGGLDAQKKTEYKIRFSGNGVYAFIVEGSGKINGIQVNRRDGIGIWETSKINIEAGSDMKILLMEVPMN